MENTKVVNPLSDQDANSEVVNTQMPNSGTPAVVPSSPVTPPGTKTESALLLESLQEERRKRRELEDKLNNLTTANPADEVVSDEGKLLAKRISDLELRNQQLEDDRELDRLQSQYPMLKDVAAEFLEYRKDYPRHKIVNVAKIFLEEKGLLEPTRKGLEQATGGTRSPLTVGMTHTEVENLRKADWRKYKEMLMNDQIIYSD